MRGAGTIGFYTVYYRDPLERLTILANDLPGTANDAPVELGYNAASQIVSRITGCTRPNCYEYSLEEAVLLGASPHSVIPRGR